MAPAVRKACSELITAALWYRLTQVKAEYGSGRGYLKEVRPFANFLAYEEDENAVHIDLMDVIGGSKYSRLGDGNFPSRAEMTSILRSARTELQRRCNDNDYGVQVHIEVEGQLWPGLTMSFTTQSSRQKTA